MKFSTTSILISLVGVMAFVLLLLLESPFVFGWVFLVPVGAFPLFKYLYNLKKKKGFVNSSYQM